MRTTTRFAASGLLAFAWSIAPAAQPYRVAPPAAWIEQVPDSAVSTTDLEPVEAGADDFRLVDYQVRVANVTEQYTRLVEHLANQSVVERSAQISIDIDPERERVLLHAIRVLRDGRFVDKLADARVSLLNREEGLERGLINGRVTLHILLQDIRMGDVLDYAYTEERSDPPAERRFQRWFGTQWSTPIRHQRVRLVHEAGRVIHVKDLGNFGEPRRVSSGRWRELSWEKRDVPALPEEASRPGWQIRYPRIEFSEFGSWAEVRAWTQPWYEVRSRNGAEFAALVADIRRDPDPAARIVRALRFVQDDIRYTGIEIGNGAWRPTAPATVLARRFGDCKDKAQLLITLLRELGVDAHPALVHSQLGRGIGERLPSSSAFDHVIAKVRFNGRDYWFDATASGQGGTLDSIAQANFGLALVLAPGVTGLETIPTPDSDAPTIRLVETYDLRKGVSAVADMLVRTTYLDAAADQMRLRTRGTTAANLGKGYLDYYRRSYRGIRQLQVPQITDDRSANRLEIVEKYAIDEPFTDDDDGRHFTLQASLITEQVQQPDQTVRTSPLARAFPLHVRHEIVALLPKPWKVEITNLAIDDAAFKYRSTMNYRDQRLELTHELHNLRDHVPVEQLDGFLVNLGKVRDDAYFTITDGVDDADSGPSFAVMMTFIVGLGIGGWLVFMIGRLPWRLPAAEPSAPVGLSGWLVLPLIGSLASPLLFLRQAWMWFGDVGDAATFNALIVRMQWLMLLETLFIAALLVLSVYTLVMMLSRRREFPAAFIALEVLAIAMLAVDTSILAVLGEDGAKEYARQSAQLVGRTIGAAAWITYMLVSKRVRATFVRPEPAAVASETSAPAPA